MTEVGKPTYWRLDEHIAAIIGMIRADELQIALKMCDEIPGYYRDNYPAELQEIKATLYQQMYDQVEYATDDEEAECTREFGESQWLTAYTFPRAEIIEKILTDEMRTPWIFDLGCSHGNLPLGLIKSNFAFDYKGVGMNWRIVEKVKRWVGEDIWTERPTPGQDTILFCSEVLEHCMNPMDVVHTAHKQGIDWKLILLSVPMYTLGGGLPDWDTRRLGHVRTWTPHDFHAFAWKNWPGYTWELTQAPSMVLVGRKI